MLCRVFGERLMARPRKLAAWEVEALALDLDPSLIRRKVTKLRASKAAKFKVSIAEMQAVYGWDLDDMASDLVSKIQHGRCRGPRCHRISFKELPLELITCDILNPADPPLWCVNVGWACSKDNKGDGARPLAQRMSELIRLRTLDLEAISDQIKEEIQQQLFPF